MPSRILDAFIEEGIKVDFWSFQKPVEMVYTKLPIPKETNPSVFLGIANHLTKDFTYFRTRLAIALGHHRNFAVPAVFAHNEYYLHKQACIWAARFLIPDKQLNNLLRQGVSDYRIVAECFNVTHDIAKLRLATALAITNDKNASKYHVLGTSC